MAETKAVNPPGSTTEDSDVPSPANSEVNMEKKLKREAKKAEKMAKFKKKQEAKAKEEVNVSSHPIECLLVQCGCEISDEEEPRDCSHSCVWQSTQYILKQKHLHQHVHPQLQDRLKCMNKRTQCVVVYVRTCVYLQWNLAIETAYGTSRRDLNNCDDVACVQINTV